MRKSTSFMVVVALVGLTIAFLIPLAKPPAHADPFAEVTAVAENADAIYWNTLAATADYFAKRGFPRPASRLKPFLDSSHRVAEMVKGFPTYDPIENAHTYFAYGGQESVYRWSYVNINFPGQKFQNNTEVKRFSLDYGWIGLNDINISLTYIVARALQEGKPLPNWVKVSLHPDARKFLRSHVRVPKDLKLLWIRPGMGKEALNQWKWAKSKRMNNRLFKKRFSHSFREKTEDDLDSMLLYRIIIEIDRRARGWEYKTWNKGVFKTLRQVRRAHRKEPT